MDTKLTKKQIEEKVEEIYGDMIIIKRISKIKRYNMTDYITIWSEVLNEVFDIKLMDLFYNEETRRKLSCYKKHRYSKKEYIEIAKSIHGDKYDYSQMNYKGCGPYDKITIKCNDCGHIATPKAAHHIARTNQHGCRKCYYKSKRLSTEEFIERARKVHGDKYDYSKVEYTRSDEKVIIICKSCGHEFTQQPQAHVNNGHGCPNCCIYNPYRHDTNIFIERARKVHGDKYDYSKVEYTRSAEKVIIICKSCGHEFTQTPSDHLSGCGCPPCSVKNRRLTTEKFIERSRKIHGQKYDYSKVNYEHSGIKVIIICNECGYEFSQDPTSHMRGSGCPNCCYITREKRKKAS